MIVQLIADSGSTKTDWCLLKDKSVWERFTTNGINPVTMSKKNCVMVIENELKPILSSHYGMEEDDSSLDKYQLVLNYYGAGCSGMYADNLKEVILESLPNTNIEINTDLLGAARAMFGRSEGIACILGTGSNSGVFDGKTLTDNISPMGFILGDEGGGTSLGKRFLNALYKRRLPLSLKRAFEEEMQMTLFDVIENVYRKPYANRFLASFSPFIHEHISEPSVYNLVSENFQSFFQNCVKPYHRPELPIGIVGSIAFVYEDCLREAARKEGLQIQHLVCKPMNSLIKYHQMF